MRTYEVQIGDTIAKVALRHRLRVFDLLVHNPDLKSEKDYLPPGKKINIPDTKNHVILLNRYECLAEYGPSDLKDDIKRFFSHYRQFCTIEEIGKSVMGKPLYLFKIGRGKKEIFYSGGWHANEWMTTKFLVDFLKELLIHLDKNKSWHSYDLTGIFKEVTLFCVPLVNPDGVELVQQGIYPGHPFYKEVLAINRGVKRFDHWSSNIRGVDLNHQWPAEWEKEAQGSPQIPWCRHYSGQRPLTEPEALAVYELTMKQSFAYVLAFHSQGQIIYWGYRNLEPPESEEMAMRLSLKSSYTPVRTADSDAGYKDWFIQEMRRPGFTIEVGVGVNPLPFSAYPEIWTNNVLLALEGLVL